MLTHTVLIKFKENISNLDKKMVIDNILKLKAKIPAIHRCFGGRDCVKFSDTHIEFNKGYTHAVCLEFENLELFTVYLNHPAQHEINDMLKNFLEDAILITLKKCAF